MAMRFRELWVTSISIPRVGRRITPKVKSLLAAHERLVGKVIAPVWFQAPQPFLPLQGCRTSATPRHLQFFRQDLDKLTKQTAEMLVQWRERHKLQTPSVIREANMSIVKGPQETAVGKPIDIVEPKRPLRRKLNGGHDVVSVTHPMPDRPP